MSDEELRRQRRYELAQKFEKEVSTWSSKKLINCYAQPEKVKKAQERETMKDRIKELKLAAKVLAKEIPANHWRYDDGITDDETGERGKQQIIETISNGEHVLIAEPMCEDYSVSDKIGNYLKLVDPKFMLRVIEKLESLEYSMEKIKQVSDETLAYKH